MRRLPIAPPLRIALTKPTISEIENQLAQGVLEGDVRKNPHIHEALSTLERELRKAHPELSEKERLSQRENLLRLLEHVERDPLIKRAVENYRAGNKGYAPLFSGTPYSPVQAALYEQLGYPFQRAPSSMANYLSKPSFAALCLPPLKSDWVSVWLQVHQAIIEAETARVRENARRDEQAAEHDRDERKRQVLRSDEQSHEVRRLELSRQGRSSSLNAEAVAQQVLSRLFGVAVYSGVHTNLLYARSIEDARHVLALYLPRLDCQTA